MASLVRIGSFNRRRFKVPTHKVVAGYVPLGFQIHHTLIWITRPFMARPMVWLTGLPRVAWTKAKNHPVWEAAIYWKVAIVKPKPMTESQPKPNQNMLYGRPRLPLNVDVVLKIDIHDLPFTATAAKKVLRANISSVFNHSCELPMGGTTTVECESCHLSTCNYRRAMG